MKYIPCELEHLKKEITNINSFPGKIITNKLHFVCFFMRKFFNIKLIFYVPLFLFLTITSVFSVKGYYQLKRKFKILFSIIKKRLFYLYFIFLYFSQNKVRVILFFDFNERSNILWQKATSFFVERSIVLTSRFMFRPQSVIFANHEGENVSLVERLFFKIHSKWSEEINNKKFPVYPWEEAFCSEILGISPDYPAWFSSSYIDLVLFESEFQKQSFIKVIKRLPKNKIIGNIKHDILFQNKENAHVIKKELAEEFGFSLDKLFVVVAFPKNKYGFVTIENFDKYYDYCNNMIDFLNEHKNKVNFIVNLHPRTANKDYYYNGVKLNEIFVSDKPIIELIPIADICIFNNVSSILSWAMALKKPVVSFDCYRYYNNCWRKKIISNHCMLADDYDDFKKRINMLINQYKTVYNEFKNQDLSRWGTIDGNVCNNITKVLLE